MTDNNITDPLVRVAFEKKRRHETMLNDLDVRRVEMALIAKSFEQNEADVAEAHAELHAVMSQLTVEQEADLVLAELAHHHSNVNRARKNIGYGPVNASPVVTWGRQYAELTETQCGLVLQPETSLVNELQVVWRKKQ